MVGLDAARLCREVTESPPFRVMGKLRSVTGLRMTCTLPAAVGDQCEILLPDGQSLRTEVIGFDGNLAHLLAYEKRTDLHPGLTVVRRGRGLTIPVGDRLLGRVLDGLGRPIDGTKIAQPAGDLGRGGRSDPPRRLCQGQQSAGGPGDSATGRGRPAPHPGLR